MKCGQAGLGRVGGKTDMAAQTESKRLIFLITLMHVINYFNHVLTCYLTQ